MIVEEAHEDLKNIVGYIDNENPGAAETLGGELLDTAMSLESLPYRGSRVKRRRGLLKLIHAQYLTYYRVQEQKLVEIVAFSTAHRSSH
jgi:plasmid stabilization system protein ParE